MKPFNTVTLKPLESSASKTLTSPSLAPEQIWLPQDKPDLITQHTDQALC